jgi:hypothetical protein
MTADLAAYGRALDCLAHDRHDDRHDYLEHLAASADADAWPGEAARVAAAAARLGTDARRARTAAVGGSEPRGKVQRPPYVKFSVPTHGFRAPQHVVLHTTEGYGDVEGLAAYFRGPRSISLGGLGVSYIIERSGRCGSLGSFTAETYHVGPANRVCIGIEQIGFARTTSYEWFKLYIKQVRSAAWTVAWITQQLDIPVRHSAAGRRWLFPSGVCEHADVPENDHTDCGPGYPLGTVLEMAAKWRREGVPLWVRLSTPKP